MHSPDAVEDEKELNEDTAKRQDASHHDGRQGLVHACLAWDLPRNLIGPYWKFHWLNIKLIYQKVSEKLIHTHVHIRTMCTHTQAHILTCLRKPRKAPTKVRGLEIQNLHRESE